MEAAKKTRIVAPQQGGQEAYVRSNVDICIFGGSLGGGKSYGSILANAEASLDPNYRAVFFRRTLGELKSAGGIVDDFEDAYGDSVFITKSENPRITFKGSGAWIECRQIADENPNKVRETFKGSQWDAVFFEELTGYQFYTWNYLASRARGKAQWSGKIRATTNPSKRHWVRQLLDWWIGPDGYVIPERSGVVRYVYLNGDSVDDYVWGDTKTEVYRKCKTSIDRKLEKLNDDSITYENLIKSFTFILGNLAENKALISKNPDYVGNVSGREGDALLSGNWNVDLDELNDMPISPAKAQAVATVDSQAGPSRYIIADLADTGKDNCFIIAMHGLEVVDVDIIPKSTPRQNCERVKRMARKHNVGDSHIMYDAQRAAYVLDYIPDAQGVYSFSKPRGMYRKDFVRLKDEYYYRLVESVNNGRFSIHPNVWDAPYIHNKVTGLTIGQEFCDECAVIRFKEDSWGRRQLAQKNDMNAMLGKDRSMDVLDCVAMGMIPYLQYEYGSELTKVKDEYSIIPEDDDYGNVDIYSDSTWC